MDWKDLEGKCFFIRPDGTKEWRPPQIGEAGTLFFQLEECKESYELIRFKAEDKAISRAYFVGLVSVLNHLPQLCLIELEGSPEDFDVVNTFEYVLDEKEVKPKAANKLSCKNPIKFTNWFCEYEVLKACPERVLWIWRDGIPEGKMKVFSLLIIGQIKNEGGSIWDRYEFPVLFKEEKDGKYIYHRNKIVVECVREFLNQWKRRRQNE
jgi:hypothetical protein